MELLFNHRNRIEWTSEKQKLVIVILLKIQNREAYNKQMQVVGGFY